jgi:hypothetical protein
VVVLVSSALQHLNVFRVGASLSSGKGGADSKAQNHEHSPVPNVNSQYNPTLTKPIQQHETYRKPAMKGQVSARWSSVPT